MGVNVVLPIRVRIDPDAFRTDPAALADAVEAATARGLAKAQTEVFATRGGYARARLTQPEISLTGPGMGLFDAGERDALIASVAEGIGRAGAGLLDALGRTRTDPPEPLREGESTAYDPARDLLGGLGYLVDSYGSGSREPGAQVAAKKGAKTTPKQSPPHQRVLSVCEPTVAALLAAGNRYLEDAVKAAFAGDYSAPAYLGVFFRNKWAGGAPWMGIIRVQLANGRLVDAGGDAHWQSTIFTHATVEKMASSQRGSTASAGLLQRWVQVGPKLLAHAKAVTEVLGRVQEEQGHYDQQIEALRLNPKRSKAQNAAIARFEKLGRKDWYQWAAAQRVNPADLGAAPFRLFQINQDNNFFVFDAGLKLVFDRLNVVPLIEDQLAARPKKAKGEGGAGDGKTSGDKGGQGAGKDGLKDGRDGKGGGDGREGGKDDHPAIRKGGLSVGDKSGGECQAYCFERPETADLSFDGAQPCEMILGPFECEPEVGVFGDLGKRMAELIREIAIQLKMNDHAWPYAGAFVINATRVVHARALLAAIRDPGELGDARPAVYGGGNLGALNATISRSAGITLLRDLGKTVHLIEQLSELVQGALGPSSTFLSDCGQAQFGSKWDLHYLKEYSSAADKAGYQIFVQACRVSMLQLLRASRQGIDWMTANFETYYPTIEGLILGPIKRLVELRRMREHILQAEAGNFLFGPDGEIKVTPGADPKAEKHGLWDETKAGASATLRVGYQGWRDAREWWADEGNKLDTIGRARREIAARTAIEGVIERQADGSFAVRETRDGKTNVWTQAQLEAAIALTQQAAESVNPIIKHMNNLEGSAAAFESGPEAAKAFVREVIGRMRAANHEATDKVRAEVLFAFRTAKLTESWTEPTVPGTNAKLSNIHAMAQQAIGDAFRGSRIYREGLKFLFGSELGRETGLPMLELAITIGAFVLFAPAGFLLSAGFAASRYGDATGHLAFTEGLIDPDQIFSRVEAELELFMSHFEILLLVVPEGGTAAKKGIQGLRALREQGLKAGVKTITRQATAHILQEFANALKGELIPAFIHQLATAKLIEPLLQPILGPVFETLMQEAATGGPGGLVASDEAEGDEEADATPDTPEELSARLQFLADYGEIDIDPDFKPNRDDIP